jgi:hypothetical protein
VRIEIDPKQNVVEKRYDDEQGLLEIEIEGSRLTLRGWFDGIANWDTVVELTDEQRAALREAL